MSDHLLKSAFRLHQEGKLAEASRMYQDVLKLQPRHFDASYLLGVAHLQRSEFDLAERMMKRALEINPSSLDALYHRGMALQNLNRHAEALTSYDRALAVRPGLVEITLAKGTALSQLGRHAEALLAYDSVVTARPDLPAGWTLRGNALLEQQRNEEAVKSYDRALSLSPDFADAWRHRALALTQMARLPEAVESLERTLRLRDADVEAWIELGRLLMAVNRHVDAAKAYDRALAFRPGDVHALYNRGNTLSILKRYEEAMRDCEQVLAIDPDYPYARGVLVHSRLQCCDWRVYDEDQEKVRLALQTGKRVISPFNHKALSDSANEQLQCAQVWVRNECPPSSPPLWRGEVYRHDRIRLAYVSADFNASAVATLMAGVFEHHDRTRFEVTAISLGSDAKTDMRSRLKNAFEHFVDARELNEHEIASHLRRREIDIAVDLMGYTGECRSGIFAWRPAPLHVLFLGFPGTMGAPYIDYIIADKIVVPDSHKPHYAEKVVHLPDTFLPSDATRAIDERVPTRVEAGLPEKGFVFASFNNAYKFSPAMFDVWMRLLSQIEGSVLWLPEHHPSATRNLRRQAEARGIESSRLIFAVPVPSPSGHLARLKLADLFLDTLPYNAHSTANDALWAGLPVLTCAGNSFAGRVAASLLDAIGLPELVADSLSAYEALALELAREPERLATIRDKLRRNRDTSPVFDTARFTRHLETAFTAMWRRHQSGEAPADFAVERMTG